MSYKIIYGPIRYKNEENGRRGWKMWILPGVLALAVCLRFMGLGELFSRMLLPGDPEVTAAAFQSMVTALWDGESVGEAFTVFCGEIIENANIPQ